MAHSLRRLAPLVPLAFLAWALAAPGPAQALPLFARKYSMPCSQCHVAYPRLNDFGMTFKQRGYILEGASGESPWESTNFPLSLIGNVGMSLVGTDSLHGGRDRERTSQIQFQQNAVEFHTAGTLAKQISFHFDNGFSTDTGVLETGMAFVQFDDLAKNGTLNLKAGIFDAEIPYLSSARRTTLVDYLAPVTLDAQGLELNGERAGWTYAAGLMNSGRTHGAPRDRTLNRMEDVYLWAMRDLRGQKVTARVLFDRQDPRKESKGSSLRTQFDLSALLTFRGLLLIPAYVLEANSDYDLETPARVHHGMLEALLPLDPAGRWVLTGRWEVQHVPGTALLAEADQWLGALNAGCYVNANAKIGLEWAHSGNNVGEPFVDAAQVYVQVGY
jgi:hypothetical protein